MHFPLTLHLGSLALSAHAPFELAAYAIGFLLLRRERARHGDVLDGDARWTLNVAVILGAVAGSKLVQWASAPAELAAHAGEFAFWLGGKSIVGGILGGTLAVELVKAKLGITRRTGDALVLPLVVSIAIGRLGCFTSGLADHTYGTATSLPWGVDFGDGIARHPTQLYEIVFLALVIAWLVVWRGRGAAPGDLFRGFVASYFGFRLVVDFLKPAACRGLGLSAIQWTCVAALGVVVPDMLRWLRRPGT